MRAFEYHKKNEILAKMIIDGAWSTSIASTSINTDGIYGGWEELLKMSSSDPSPKNILKDNVKMEVKKMAKKTKQKEEIEKEVTKEIKRFMTQELKETAKKEAGQLFKDIEKIKKEKTTLDIQLKSFKAEVKDTKKILTAVKKDVKKQIDDMNAQIEKFGEDILRFKLMDL